MTYPSKAAAEKNFIRKRSKAYVSYAKIDKALKNVSFNRVNNDDVSRTIIIILIALIDGAILKAAHLKKLGSCRLLVITEGFNDKMTTKGKKKRNFMI